jgi:hypothetical protein
MIGGEEFMDNGQDKIAEKKCPKCGEVASDKAKYCNACGTLIAKASVSSDKKWLKLFNFNHSQKIIIAIMAPFIVFFNSYNIASAVDKSFRVAPYLEEYSIEWRARNYESPRAYDPDKIWSTPDPFCYQTTWFVWLGAFLITGVIELFLFRSKEEKI